MKNLFTIIGLLLFINSNSQTQYYQKTDSITGLQSNVSIDGKVVRKITSQDVINITAPITAFGLITWKLGANNLTTEFGKYTTCISGLALLTAIPLGIEENNSGEIRLLTKPTTNDVIRYISLGLKGFSLGAREAFKFYNVPDNLNPDKTWMNKYKNGDPNQGEAFLGSTTIFSSLTDNYHRLNTLYSVADITYTGTLALKYYNNKYKKKELIFKIVTECLINFIITNGVKTITMDYYKYKYN